jgi:hypothetical protein
VRKEKEARLRYSICVVLLLASAVAAWGQPSSVFVVHCEPTNADSVHWSALIDLVALADRHGVPLSIDFTAQWAEMILGDETKTKAVSDWLDGGHEIGCHHHPYWTLLERAATWDGYTDTAIDEILPQDRADYRGTMDDYMALLDALPGERRSGCLGSSDARDEGDWPCSLVYSTAGNAIDDAVSRPIERTVGGCEVTEIGHALLVGAERGALRALYEATATDAVFGVVGHVYNYLEFPAAFEQWFAFLDASDPDGERCGTVTAVLDAWGASD